ncbi:MAG: hypothetical protein ABIA63_04300 [bacterium]
MNMLKKTVGIGCLLTLAVLMACTLVGKGKSTGAGDGEGSGNPLIAPQGCDKYVGAVAIIKDTVIDEGGGGSREDTTDLSAKWAEAQNDKPDIIGPYTLNNIRVMLDSLVPDDCAGKTISGVVNYRILKGDSVYKAGGTLVTITNAEFCKFNKTWLDPRTDGAASHNPIALKDVVEAIQKTANGETGYKIITSSVLTLAPAGSSYEKFHVIVEIGINGFTCLDNEE